MSITSSMTTRVALLAVTGVGLSMTLAACGTDANTESPAGSGSSTTTLATTSGTTPTSDAGTTSTATLPLEMGSTSYPPVTPGPPATGAHNDADVSFADGMIPHHGQAVVMADMILARSDNTKVKALAETIKKAQTPEIATLSGWLKSWGATPPDPYGDAGGMSGVNHGGMMSVEQMDELKGAQGARADTLFLTQMIEHHRGAVVMAKTQLAQGANQQGKDLAQSIITSQNAEITTMQNLLATLA